MALCEQCKEVYKKNHLQTAEILPWFHCHHDEKKMQCEVCQDGRARPLYLREASTGSMQYALICPKCGRNLKDITYHY